MKICNVIYNCRHGRWSEIQKPTTFIRRIVILMAKSSPVNAIHPVAMYVLTSMLWIVPISIELRHEKRLCSQARNCALQIFPISINWGRYLLDIDECSEDFVVKMNDCHLNASCVNTQGSYNCSCNPTYIGNGSLCEGKFMIFSLRNFIMYV